MKPFQNHRTKRNTAFAMMLVWLFALASGMANACLLESPGTHAQTTKVGHLEAAGWLHALAGHSADVDDHGDDSDAARESCLKTCDDGSNAQVKLQIGSDLSDPGAAPLIAIGWGSPTRTASMSFGPDHLQPPIVGPPFRVRYSRLTL
ncbi:MAG: hypothetical protein HYX43_07390 [Burkholderiales bacterium]|nr:hypothetical protein [Burkholderiales bacterium]